MECESLSRAVNRSATSRLNNGTLLRSVPAGDWKRDTYACVERQTTNALLPAAGGDDILLTAVSRNQAYEVESTRVIVSLEDFYLLKDIGRLLLTLLICCPFYHVGSAPKRSSGISCRN